MAHPAPLTPVPAAHAPVTVRTLTSVEDLTALAPCWNALHERAAGASIFNSWIWQYEWWRAYGTGRSLRLLVAESGGEAIGLLPLHLQQERRLGATATIARLVGNGGDTYPDDLGAILAPGHEEAAARALAQAALAIPGVDVLRLLDMEPGTPFPAAMEAAARAAGLSATRAPAERIVYINLPETWEAYLASVTGHRRRHIRGARKKLNAERRVRFLVWDDAGRLGEAFQRLSVLHHRRWRAAGEESGSFQTPQYLGFHEAVMRSLLARGWLRLYCLEVDDEIVAMLYAYRFRKGIYVMQAGFDPGLAKWRIGQVLLNYSLEHAIGEGDRVFDFLRGAHSYKDELATSERETVSVTVLKHGFAAAAWHAGEIRLPAWKRRLKALLRRPKA
ncbi:MAG TPA: GNAT family N-acetyltransferase [Burkholderiales bacterium]|nr:GNAT family N-acetyltransferase [Burkholderiales bacterium]